jgi:hypothetical protein
MKLAVSYEHAAHRFLKSLDVHVSSGSTTLDRAPGSGPGHALFDVPETDGAELEVRLSIPEPPGSGLGHPLLDFKQRLRVTRPTGAAPMLTAAGPAWDPRLRLKGVGKVVTLYADLRFLDVTDYADAIGVEGWSTYATGIKTFFSAAPHHGVKLRLLEYTGGKPVAWAVAVPPLAALAHAETHVCLFFRPSGDPYGTTDDVWIGASESDTGVAGGLIRYLADPQRDDAPWHARLMPPPPAPPTDLLWDDWPPCGWERQLSEASKRVLLVHPFPHGSDFGVAAKGKVAGLMTALVNTLWATGAVAAGLVTGLKRGRLAVAGFSYGGSAALATLAKNEKDVDEAYLFDPVPFAEHKPAVKAWFKPGRKLRMVGAYGLSGMLDLAAELSSPDVTVWPPSMSYWESSAVYRASVSLPPPLSSEFSTVSAAVPSTLSDRTGLFFVGTTPDFGVELEARRPDGSIIGRRTFAPCSSAEAAMFARRFVPSRFGSMKEFATALAGLTGWVGGVRHQWPVIGGEGAVDRGKGFKGYLHLCLERSAF